MLGEWKTLFEIDVLVDTQYIDKYTVLNTNTIVNVTVISSVDETV